MEQEVLYYYLKDENEKPFGCVAICENEDGTINKGVSICSKDDTFKKICARGIAFKRLNEAMKNKNTAKFASYHGNEDKTKCPVDINSEVKYAYAIQPTAKEHRMFHKPVNFS